MNDISLHVLDIAENSVNAGASKVTIEIKEELINDRFILKIVDDGKGIELENKTEDPYFTGKSCKRFGLGLPLLRQSALECGGAFSIFRNERRGTTVVAEFQRSHMDMKPLGDLGSTVAMLVCGHPELDYSVSYEADGYSYMMDTEELRGELEGAPLNLPAVLEFIRKDVNEGVRRTGL